MSDLECLRNLVTQAEGNPARTRFSFNGIASDDDYIAECGRYHF
jgi:hypothetical protein